MSLPHPGRRHVWTVFVALLLWGSAGAAPAPAQTLNLSLSSTSIPFASADPDTTPFIDAPVLIVDYRVRGNWGSNWAMTVIASGDLSSGAATIPISAITWTATPAPPFSNGTMSATIAQTLASGSNNVNPADDGFVVFRLANSWSYDTGTYTATFTFTLTAP